MRDISFSPAELRRYARHLILPEVGVAGQKKIRASSVLCLGAGGLGSPALLYLAAAGIGRLGLVDSDTVDLSNLQRQVIHGTSDIGRLKTDSARDAVHHLNPDVEVVPHPQRLTSQNALQIIKDYDVVLDGTDNFRARYLANDACGLLRKPNVYAAVFQFEGQASLFAPHLGGPCYRCLYPEPPPPPSAPTCAEAGILGVLPGILGCIQATEALKLILGQGRSLLGRLLRVDALTMRFSELKVRSDPECRLCGPRATIRELTDLAPECVARRGSGATDTNPAEVTMRNLDRALKDQTRR